MCGSDGETYSNACGAKCQGVTIVHNGACEGWHAVCLPRPVLTCCNTSSGVAGGWPGPLGSKQRPQTSAGDELSWHGLAAGRGWHKHSCCGWEGGAGLQHLPMTSQQGSGRQGHAHKLHQHCRSCSPPPLADTPTPRFPEAQANTPPSPRRRLDDAGACGADEQPGVAALDPIVPGHSGLEEGEHDGASHSCICPAVWMPVCGSNNRTYGNDCEARCAGVAKWQRGACGDAQEM